MRCFGRTSTYTRCANKSTWGPVCTRHKWQFVVFIIFTLPSALAAYFGIVATIVPFFSSPNEAYGLSTEEIESLINNRIQDVTPGDESSTLSLPGWSFHVYCRLKSNGDKRLKYIFDYGLTEYSDRISVFLDERDNLCFRLIDQFGQSHPLWASRGGNTYQLDVPIYLIFEYGHTPSKSFMKIYANGKKISEVSISYPLDLQSFQMEGGTLGADLNGKYGGVFDLAEHLVYHKTLTDLEKAKLVDYFQKKQFLKWVSFNGAQWMRQG